MWVFPLQSRAEVPNPLTSIDLIYQLIHAFIHSFPKYLLCFYCGLGMVLGLEDTAGNKSAVVPPALNPHSSGPAEIEKSKEGNHHASYKVLGGEARGHSKRSRADSCQLLRADC